MHISKHPLEEEMNAKVINVDLEDSLHLITERVNKAKAEKNKPRAQVQWSRCGAFTFTDSVGILESRIGAVSGRVHCLS